MGIEKQGSTDGNHARGFLQMFDWNTKSRKKLFSSKSDIPEQSKQKKRCDGNLPMTRLQILDDDENASSIKGSSDYSCASSVMDGDIRVPRAPGVVARLMGLDALPKFTTSDPFFDSRSLHDSYYQTKTHGYCLGHVVFGQEDAPVGGDTRPKYQKVIHRPIEKFQAEILPPKSARSIPITHHKLLSPIKSGKFIPSKDAAHIMEVAARIIEPAGPRSSAKTKMHTSSVPLKVRDLKEKVRTAQKQSKKLESGSQQRADQSRPVKSLRGHSTNKGLNEVAPNSEEFSAGAMHKGKSISLALLAKANVQKREGINLNSSRTGDLCPEEPCEVSPDQVFKDQLSDQKSLLKKQSTQIGSSVLRQNNQKQNSIINGGKSSSKCSSKGVKLPGGESASARQPNFGKLSRTSKVSSRNSGSDIKDDRREVSLSSTVRVTRKKRSMDGKNLSEKSKTFHKIRENKNRKATTQSSAPDTDRQSSLEHNDVKAVTNISFTFTASMAQSGPDSERCVQVSEESIMSPVSSDVSCASKFSLPGYNAKGSDALSFLLEQKLKELSLKVEFSQQKSETESHDGEHDQRSTMSSTVEQRKTIEDELLDNNQVLEDLSIGDLKISQGRKLLDCRFPSPVSVLQHFSFGDSCNSSDTADSTEGSKQCLSIQMLDSCSLKTSVSIEGDAELSDSASSTFAGTIAKVEATTTASIKNKKRTKWEPDYIKKILHNIEPMFMDYTLGRSDEIISPHLFNQVGNHRKHYPDNGGTLTRTNQRLLFDCVRECLDMKCTQYVCGGFKLWTKGMSMVSRKDRLAEEVYKEISDWSGVGDSMIDELVDQDMSSQYGKWLDFDRESFQLGMQIESRLVNSLVDEAIADMLGL